MVHLPGKSAVSESTVMLGRNVLLILGLLLLASTSLPAQSYTGGGAYYYFARPGDRTVLVSLWGAVRLPGKYEVREGTDLADLLSIAGGPMTESETGRAFQEIRVSISRSEASQRRIVFDMRYDSLLVYTGAFPVLQEGDIVNVRNIVHERFNWRDAISITTAMAAIALVIERLVRLF